MHELWKRVERLEHPIWIEADYQRRDRGDFDDESTHNHGIIWLWRN